MTWGTQAVTRVKHKKQDQRTDVENRMNQPMVENRHKVKSTRDDLTNKTQMYRENRHEEIWTVSASKT